ncbi:MAG TPA: sigma-70 family RNA polymerase sigma factor [Stellaceae bacterium]|jgi:RNA polymerase sigma-70 factor (ECF subfamily)|nr:sigma-70 family RNA polymerase sigma factor [Stellaceae bacterium]
MTDMMVLIEPMIPALRRYARALLRDRSLADDLVQDCLERAITRWHQRRPDGDARTWVFTILHNLAINQQRRATRRGPHVPIEDAGDSVLARPGGQEDRLRHHELMAGLAALPEEQRSVLLLVAVEDLSYAEAAKVLNIPIGTVMSRLARAREKLLRIMETGSATQAGGAVLRRVK